MAQLLTGTRIYGTGTVDTQLFVNGTNSATSTTTGALQVVGGVGIGGKLYVGDTINGNLAGGSTGAIVYQSNSNITAFLSIGSNGQILQSNGSAPVWIPLSGVSAGLATTATHLSGGVAGQIPYQTAPGVTAFLSTGTAGDVLVSNGSSAPTYNNTLTLRGTTAATSTATGALVVAGGVGIGQSLFVQENIVQVGETHSTLATTYNLINTTATTVNFAGAATSLNVGATSGSTNVRNNLTVSGNLTVQGTTTIVDSTVTNIADPIITLGGGTGNTAPTADDNKDRGVAFKWVNNSGTTSTGFFGYDDSTGYLTYVPTATITNEVVSGTKGAMDVNLAGGTEMSIHYQSAADTTAFLAAGSSGYLLQTNGTGSAPTWVSASGVSAGSATNADNIRTIAQTASASYYPTFVDSNNASNAYESLYTTGTFVINPATGYIGMGTASPGRPLHVVSIGTATQGIAAFEANSSGLVIQTNSGQNGNVEIVGYKQSSSTYHNILLRGSSSGLLVQNTTGNVGIGNLTPIAKLHIGAEDEPNMSSQSLFVQGSKTGYAGFKGLPQGQLLIYDDTASTAGSGGTIGFGANTGASQRTWIASINSERDSATNDATNYGGSLAFYTRPAQSTPLERMRIISTGTVVINPGGSNQIGPMLDIYGGGYSTYGALRLGDGSVGAHTNWWDIGRENNYTGDFTFALNGTEKLRITTAGGITFGTASGYGSSGQVLKSNGNAAPTWVDPSTLASASATNADNIRTIAQAANASYYPTFVDSNNASNAYELVYTTSSFQINPFTGNIQIGMTSQDYQPSSGGNHTLRLNAANTSSIGFHDSGSTIASIKFSGAYGFEIGAYDGTYGPHNTILHGSVGVGTQNPTAKFTINNTGSTSAAFYADIGNPGSAITLFEHTGASTPVPFRFRKSGFSGVAPNYGLFYLHMNDGTVGNGSNLYFNLNNSAGTEIEYAGLGAIIRSNTAASEQGDLALYVMQNGTGRTERLRITSAGALAFSGASSYGSSGQVLQSNGNAPPTWVNQNTISSGSAPLTNTYVGFGSSSNLLTGSANLTYASSILNVAYQNTFNTTTPGTGQYGIHLNGQTTADSATGITFSAGGAGAGNAHAGIYSQGSGSYGTKMYFATTDSYAVGAKTRMMIDHAGNVGIGTTDPASFGRKFLVNGTGGFNNDSGTVGIGFSKGAALTYGYIGTGDWAVNYLSAADFGISSGATGALAFGTASGSEKMRIASGGNVGIGTSSPTAKLHVSGNAIITGNAVIGATTTTNKFEVAGTAGQLFSVSDSFTGTIFSVNDVSGIPSIEVLDTGLVKLAQYNGQLAIGTGTVASSTATVSIYGMLYTMGTLGEIRASSEITAYFSSDRRLKENIKLIENPITIIDQIRGVTFDWTDEHMARRGGEDGYFVRKHDIGVIAQEVQAVLPELVGTREDGYLAVKYEKMVALLIEAIKAQQKTIDSLVKDLDNVKEFINNFKNGI